MTVVASDTFDGGTAGTTLPAYSSSWVKPSYAGVGNWVITDAGRVRCNGLDAVVYHTADPSSADYTVSADLYCASTGGQSPGVIGRASTTANTFYMARWSGGWQLYRRVGGSFGQISSTVSFTPSAGGTYNLKLVMAGSTISLYANGSGTPTISGTDTQITAVGKAGLRDSGGTSDSTCLHVDNFLVEEAGGGGAGIDATISGATLKTAARLSGGAMTAAPALSISGAILRAAARLTPGAMSASSSATIAGASLRTAARFTDAGMSAAPIVAGATLRTAARLTPGAMSASTGATISGASLRSAARLGADSMSSTAIIPGASLRVAARLYPGAMFVPGSITSVPPTRMGMRIGIGL